MPRLYAWVMDAIKSDFPIFLSQLQLKHSIATAEINQLKEKVQ